MNTDTRLPDYWTHLDGEPCLSERLLNTIGGQTICDDHDRIVRPPEGGDE